jgi:hypothetical protein
MSFDAQANGLYSHYNLEQQQVIKRLMLEDWKKSGTKLPTYMKLVARFIMPVKVSDEWLKKLSHQTMAKMLSNASTPRYEFWACLHLYLIKKYQLMDLSHNQDNEFDSLGHSLAAFGKSCIKPNPSFYRLSDNETLVIHDTDSKSFTRVAKTSIKPNAEPFGAVIETHYQGVATQQGDKLVTVLKDMVNGQIINGDYMLSELTQAQTV